MPETQDAGATPPADKAKDTIAISAATMGHDLVAALLHELRNMPDHWARLNQDLQQKAIERIKEKVAGAVHKAQHMLTASEFQAVPATLDFVNRKGGIRAGITVQKDALCRHALFDAAGSKVLVVIVDPQRWLQRMDELKATGNQQDLFNSDATYDPKVDQPGYRRDQDPFAPGVSWADMKAKLGIEGETSDKPADAEKPATPTGDDQAVDPAAVQIRELHERLVAAGCDISLGAVQARTDEERLHAVQWLEYAQIGDGNPIARPEWLPEQK